MQLTIFPVDEKDLPPQYEVALVSSIFGVLVPLWANLIVKKPFYNQPGRLVAGGVIGGVLGWVLHREAERKYKEKRVVREYQLKYQEQRLNDRFPHLSAEEKEGILYKFRT